MLSGIACILCIVGAGVATGCKETKQELAYYLSEDGTYYIVSGIGTFTDEELTIPQTYRNLPVKGIFDRAFYDCDGLKRVSIPDSITELGYGIFANCDRLESAVIGKGVRTLPSAVFADCKNLFSVTLGSNVENIVVDAFENCTRLAEVYNLSRIPLSVGEKNYGKVAYYAKDVYTDLSEKSKIVTNKDGFVLHSDGETISVIAYTGTSSVISMPEKATVICDYAFEATSAVQSVTIDKKISTIGAYAFADCPNLQSVTLEENVESVGAYAFYNCDRLTEFSIGDGVQSIAKGAFANSDALEEISISDSVTTLGEEAFLQCKALKRVTLGNGVHTLQEKTFQGCTALERVSIGSGVTQICPKVFEGCTALASAEFARTSVWWVTDGPVETSGLLVDKAVMQSPISAAYYLTGEYKDRYWNRSESGDES